VVISNRQDWLSISSTPSRFKALLIWTSRTPVSILKDIQRFLIFVENKYFQSCHTSCHNTRAGFDSAPLVSIESGCSSIIKDGPPLSTVRYGDMFYPGLLLTYKTARAFERSCAHSQDGAICPIFEGDMPP
jgi:hypothetical protein